MEYKSPDTTWFADAGFGVAFHWTAQSKPVSGPAKPFAAAVAEFPVEDVVSRVAATGAAYLLFTATHALQQLPAPCAAIDHILPGRTTKRDLLMELADACQTKGLRFLLYYNHSCNMGDDPAWEKACGYHDADKSRFVNNLCAIVAELGQRYGPKVAAWWFDSSPSLDPSGPYKSVSTDMTGFQFPWEHYTAAAKTGHAGRLVTYNPGMQPHEWLHRYTTHQDYLSGEVNSLIDPPTARYAANGLQNHRWVCLDNPKWLHGDSDTPLAEPRYGAAEVAGYLRAALQARTPISFNIDTDQGGRLNPQTLRLLHDAGKMSRTTRLAASTTILGT